MGVRAYLGNHFIDRDDVDGRCAWFPMNSQPELQFASRYPAFPHNHWLTGVTAVECKLSESQETWDEH